MGHLQSCSVQLEDCSVLAPTIILIPLTWKGIQNMGTSGVVLLEQSTNIVKGNLTITVLMFEELDWAAWWKHS